MSNVAEIWELLDQVPDPEIPVISVVDLGIVRDVSWCDDMLEVTVTPTYSGCPATAVIAADIDKAIRKHGVENFRIRTQLAPPWTTDWMSEKGPREPRCIRDFPARAVGWSAILSALRQQRSFTGQPVRLDPVQGPVALRRLPGALRPLQVHLKAGPCRCFAR